MTFYSRTVVLCNRCGEKAGSPACCKEPDPCNASSELRIYNAFVAVEYDFKVIARSEAEAIENARQTWMQATATVAVAHAEVELSDEALDSPDMSDGD